MERFNIENFLELAKLIDPAAQPRFDPFSAVFRNMRFTLPIEKIITVDSSMSANLPGLAHRHLGETSLWWVLLYFNGLQDPVQDVVAGLQLRIPSRRSVVAMLESTSFNSDAKPLRF